MVCLSKVRVFRVISFVLTQLLRQVMKRVTRRRDVFVEEKLRKNNQNRSRRQWCLHLSLPKVLCLRTEVVLVSKTKTTLVFILYHSKALKLVFGKNKDSTPEPESNALKSKAASSAALPMMMTPKVRKL